MADTHYKRRRSLLVKPNSVAVALILLALLSSLRWSSTLLMPEGLEEGLTHQDLADLVEFVFADVR